MKKILVYSVIIILTLSINCNSINGFKGIVEIVVIRDYIDNISKIDDNTIGDTLITYYDEGEILTFFPNGTLQFEYISNKKKIVYDKYKQFDTILYVKSDIDFDKIISINKYLNCDSILGVSCNKIVIAYDSADFVTEEVLYSPRFQLNPKDFNNCLLFNIYNKIVLTKSVPLRKTFIYSNNEKIIYQVIKIKEGDYSQKFDEIEKLIDSSHKKNLMED